MNRTASSSLSNDEKNSFLRRVLDFVDFGTIRFSIEGIVEFMDEGALRILELEDKYTKPAELIGKPLFDTIKLGETEEKFKRELREKGYLHDIECGVRTFTGKRKCLVCHATLTYNIKTKKENIHVVLLDGVKQQGLERGVADTEVTDQRKTESALKEIEDKYRTLIEKMPDGILILQDMKVMYVNQRFLETVGYSKPEEVVGTSFKNFIHRDNRKGFFEVHGKIEDGKDKNVYETVLRHRRRRRVDVEINENPIVYYGKPAHLLFIQDLTERRSSEEEFQKLFVAVQQSPSIIVLTDNKGRIEYVNPKFTLVTGYRTEEVVGKNPKILKSDRVSREVYASLWKTISKGEDWKGELCNRRKDGSFYWENATISPVRNSEGAITHFLKVAEDITEYRLAAKALKRSEEKYRQLFEESKDVVYITSYEGRFIDVNQAGVKLFGYSSKEELKGVDIAQTLYKNPKDREVMQREIRKRGFLKDYEIELKKKNGQIISALITNSILYDEAGNVTGYWGFIRDITEKKQLEQQFFHAQKMESIGLLAGGIAHDFNNILSAIMGYASLMKMKMDQKDPLYEHVDVIESSAERAAELTTQLLAFAREGDYHKSTCNVNIIFQETVKLIKNTFDKSIAIETRFSPFLPPVIGDSGQIHQVFMNLCLNARDAMPDGGRLIIETGVTEISEAYGKTHIDAKTGKHVVVYVTDTGTGMDEATKQRIFEPFFTTKEQGKGTGLGLAVVYGIVKKHGGFIHVYSEEGKGSTFKVYLPVKSGPKIDKADKDEPVQDGHEGILVVDDEFSVRNLASAILKGHGYKVFLAMNGEEAVEVYKKNKKRIDLVILDLIMPIMGGITTYEKLKKINPQLKVLLSTGFSLTGKAKELLQSGLCDLIQKPFQVKSLLLKVRQSLDS